MHHLHAFFMPYIYSQVLPYIYSICYARIVRRTLDTPLLQSVLQIRIEKAVSWYTLLALYQLLQLYSLLVSYYSVAKVSIFFN